MLVGIVSECTDGVRTRKHRRFFKHYTVKHFENSDLAVELLAVSMPYTVPEFEKLKPERKRKVIERAVLRLCEYGVRNIVFSSALAGYRESSKKIAGVKLLDGSDIFYRFVPDMIRKAAKKCGLRLIDARIGIAALKMDRITEYLIRELCFDSKRMTLYTDATDSDSDFFEKMFDETGFAPELKGLNACDPRHGDIFIDTDRHAVRVGRDMVIDSLELELDIGGYRIDTLDVAACLGTRKISCLCLKYKSGRFVLTLPEV